MNKNKKGTVKAAPFLRVLNKVVTDVAPTKYKQDDTLVQDWENKYSMFARVGSGLQYIPVDREFMEQIMQEDYLPEVKDLKAEGEIVWGAAKTEERSNTGTGTITQGDSSWRYNGLKSDLHLSKATNDELNYTKHLTFAGEGGTIKLDNSINMGAGKLTFKNDYTNTESTS